jgi:glycine/D-amino acid oxidase-like deaminating enzyme
MPLWLDYRYDPRPPLERGTTADVCVIGGGVAGVSCARELALRGAEVVLLEARTVASGASGRNGGFLLAGAAPFHVDARQRWGTDVARRLYERTVEVQEEVYGLAAAIGAGAAVRRVGSLRLATTPEEAEHVRRHVEALLADGFDAELLERDALEPALARIGHAGCLVRHDGALQPARWIRALADDAERKGGRKYEGTPADPGPPARAGGTGATVDASTVVAAADGALPRLVPEAAGTVRARRLHMLASAPLEERMVNTLVYARYGYEYFQQTPEGRIALGGFSDLDGADSYTDQEEGNPVVWERLERYLLDDLGVSGGEITHRWVGIVGFSEGDRPLVRRIDERLYALGGYSGTGNLIGFIAGRAVAEHIASGRSSDLDLLALEPA